MKDESVYHVLGVPADADEATIRKAYRRVAKATHPDHGGDPAAFDRAAKAMAILGDPERRRRYDENGDTAQPDVNAAALEILTSLLQDALFADDDPIAQDLRGLMLAAVAAFRDKSAQQLAKERRAVARLERLAKRWRKKGKDTPAIANLLEAQREPIRVSIRLLEARIATAGRAREILENHEFSAETSGWPNRSTEPLWTGADFGRP